MVYDYSSKLCCSVPQKFCLFTCVNGAWRPIPGLTSFHFLFHMCWNEGNVENVHCDTETWRMWESQSSRSKLLFSPTLFSCIEVKVFCIVMRISDGQRSHPESFTIRHEDICLSGRSYSEYQRQLRSLLFCLLLSRSLPLQIVNSSFVYYDKQQKTFTHHNNSSTSALADLGNKCFSWVAEISICALPFRNTEAAERSY